MQGGETWCSIAVAAGFLDCRRLRNFAANRPFNNRQLQPGDVVIVPDLVLRGESGATERRHFFRRRAGPIAAIRFVHGSRHLTVANDLTLNELNVSNYVTNLAGATGAAAFPNDTVRRFDADAHEDEDAFKVEVLDTRTANRNLNVRLEALRPTYDALGIAMTGHIDFVGADLAARTLNAIASKQGGTRRFRTGYLRLVVDTVDQAALPRQTLLVTDMVASGDRRVEILDQDVRATYELDTCPSAPRCLVRATAQIGRGSTVDLAVRVLRAVPSGIVETTVGGPGDNGVIPLAQIRTRIETFVRRYWAQAHVRFNLSRLETVDLPSNMITVADATANLASGVNPAGAAPGQIGFRLRVQRFGGAANSTHVIAPFNVPAGSNPEQTATLIKNAIDVLPRLSATVDVNPPEFGDPVYPTTAGTNGGSTDVLITDDTGGRITITNLTGLANQDAAQIVGSVSLTLAITFRNSAADYHVGHPQQRNLVKALNTGDTVIDIEVVNNVPGVRGFTVPEQSDFIVDRQPVSGVKNSIIMPIISTDGTVNNPFSLPHEIGHILTDNGLHSSVNTQLMKSGTDGLSLAITDSKRIWSRAIVAHNWQVFIQNADGSLNSAGTTGLNAVARVQATSADLLH